jgi:hypothetical protein
MYPILSVGFLVHAAVQKVHQIYKRRNRPFHYIFTKKIKSISHSHLKIQFLPSSFRAVYFLQAPGAKQCGLIIKLNELHAGTKTL